ncbi:MAG: ABC transporter ATP-binding protein [Anaerolineaceae bacterium]|nr:ABC transporter ATP-binding protein [Anaerolineaceae bacterium]
MSILSQNYQPIELKKVTAGNKLRSLFYLMKGFYLHYFIAILFTGLSALARTWMYTYLGTFVDTVLDKGIVGRDLVLGALNFGALIVLQALSSFMASWMANYSAENSTRRLRDLLFDHIQRLPFAYHSEAKTGDLLERATSDVDTIRRFFGDQAIGLGRIVLIFGISFVSIAKMNLNLALVSIIVFPIVLVFSMIFFKALSKAYEAYQEQGAVLSTELQENLSGVRVVKAFARQDYEMKKFDADNLKKFDLGRKFNWMHSLFWPLTDGLCGAQNIISGYMAAMMVINNTMSLGQFMTFMGLLGWLIWPVRNLGRLIVDTSRTFVSLGRINKILEADQEDMTSSNYQPENGIKGALQFENVCFQYEEGQPVLDDVNFSCKAGEVVALLGSTGSGKTSLVNLLPRFYDVSSGRILLDGVNLNDYSREFLRSQIGIVEQEPFLFSATIGENITYGVHREVSEEEVVEAAKEAAIHDVILEFKNGYDTAVGERGVTLSGGQKQRLAIARTLLINPRILIMDDSTSSVDMETEVQIRDALDGLMENRTTFVIAHRIQSIMNADQILVFDQGKIVQKGKHEDLVNKAGIYRDIYEIQSRIDSALQEEIERVDL